MADRKIKGIRDLLHPIKGKRKSIVKDIDDACVAGITSSGVFSIRNVKNCINDVLDTLEGDFDRDKFFIAFQNLYSVVMAPDRRARGVFHPSQLLTDCERKMIFELKGETPTDYPINTISASLQRTFDVGTWYHIYIQNILFKLGYLEGAEVPVVNPDRYLNGKADGVFKESVFGERVVLEIKTMNSWSFQKAPFRPFKHHEFQASLYARELGINKILYLYINKDTSAMRDFLLPIDMESLELADKKMNRVIHSVKSGTLLERHEKCTDKLCDMALGCPFTTICYSHE